MDRNRPIEILLVDDNPGDVRLTKEALAEGKIRHHLQVACDGVEALEILRRTGKYATAPVPDIIILDLNLPRKNGREVLAEIKADENLKRIPVVVMTTSASPEDVRKAYDLHANCYITKPMAVDRLVRVVKSIETFWFSTVRLPGRRPG